MTLSEIITIAGARINKQTSVSDVKTRFISHVNTVREFAWDKYDWSFKKRGWSIRLYPQINTGTASVVNGSSTVTVSSSVFSSPYVGGFFRLLGSVPESWYRIVAQGGTTLTLDVPYQGATNATGSYEVRKTDYLIPSEIAGSLDMTDSQGRIITVDSKLVRPTMIPDTKGRPDRAVVWSDDPIGTSYTTGTITGTVDTRTITGSGTSWLTNVTAGDQLEVAVSSTTYKYQVRSVESDTSLTLYQFLRVGISAGTSYTLRNQFGRIARFSATPDDEYYITLTGVRHIYPLAHDNDTDELLTYHSSALIEGIIGLEEGASPDDRENPQIAKFVAMLGTKAGTDARNAGSFNPLPISIPWGNYRA